MEIRWKLHFYGHICTDLGIPIAGDTEEKEKLKKLSKWGKWQIAKFSHTSKIRNSLYCNVDFELIQPIEFQNKTNTENYWVLINAFWIRLRFVKYRFVRCRFVRY